MCSNDYDFMLQQALLNCAVGIYKLFMQNRKGRVLNGPTSTNPNLKTLARTRRGIWGQKPGPKKPEV